MVEVAATDTVAASVVQRIFGDFLSGKGIFAIAEGLTRDGILSPSAHDPGRNRHRTGNGGAWSKSAVRAILLNPRYTGRQVWNRQRRDEVLIDVDDVALGHETKMRWNEPGAWVWSQHDTHPALIPIGDFEAAQTIFSGAQRAAVRREHTRHPYLLSGRISCAICGRKMQGSWNNGKPYYRCKFPSEYAIAADQHDRTVYVRERSVVPGLDEWLAGLFDDEHLDATCAALAEASQLPEDDHEVVELDLRRRLKECETKLARYRDVLERGTEATVVGDWIAEVDRERRSPSSVSSARNQPSEPSPHPRSRRWSHGSRTLSLCSTLPIRS